mmetsp:Transcript_52316/g.78156  ORF Transcript_52316/g.78156 Transcript_52316/m.78156 type:complete len:1129 (-) Transcript_52316:61-3447(-)
MEASLEKEVASMQTSDKSSEEENERLEIEDDETDDGTDVAAGTVPTEDVVADDGNASSQQQHMLQVLDSSPADVLSLASMEEESHTEEDEETADESKANEFIVSDETVASRDHATASDGAASDATSPSQASNAAPEEKVKADWKQELVPIILLSLPIDSLHCIASFLPTRDWAAFGQTSLGSNKVCRDIFRRVRMHGFRCATEVVTAWKLGQHSDARELSALYIQHGVPVYPSALGHSYHTLVWRMGVESKDMSAKKATEKAALEDGDDDDDSNNPADGDDNDDESLDDQPIDGFYAERHDRANQDMMMPATSATLNMSYLEQKCLYWIENDDEATGRAKRASLTGRINLAPPAPLLANGGQPPPGTRLRLPDFRPASAGIPDGIARSPSRASSVSESVARQKPVVKIHRHLVDQHFLSNPAVDDCHGSMPAAPVSLSADFFHPQVLPVARPQKQEHRVAPGQGEHFMEPFMDFHQVDRTNAASAASIMGFQDDQEEDFDSHQQLEQLMAAAASASPQQAPLPPTLSPPPPPQPTPDELFPTPPEPSILDEVELDVYSVASTHLSSSTAETGAAPDGTQELKSHLRNRFAVYHRRLDTLMKEFDNINFEECLLDFWDEFLPVTANIHFYDRNTAVPRLSGLSKFLTKPLPKAFGIVQCEIERIKIHSKKKGVNVKGRLFPTYEYRLFIRDRRFDDHSATPPPESATQQQEEDRPPRKDTVLMMAKNRGKKHHDTTPSGHSSSSKKGVNNYYMYAPQQDDVDSHYKSVNKEDGQTFHANGTGLEPIDDDSPELLGRLQSNFIGTEFQIFTPTLQKRAKRTVPIDRSGPASSGPDSENDLDYDSGVSSDTPSSGRRRGRFSRRSRKARKHQGDATSIPTTSDHPLPIEEEDDGRSLSPEKRRRHRRSYSLPSLGYPRSSRANRKVAISNPPDESDGQPSFQRRASDFQTVICEEENGAITYTANLLGNRPRIMDVCIPRVSDDGFPGREWKRYLESIDDDGDGSSSRMLTRFKELQSRTGNDHDSEEENDADDGDGYSPPDDFGLLALQNRSPWWNIELGAFVLNFGGRVSVASVKNFQLCDRNNQEHIMLQFGRIQGRHAFTMDCQFPLTPVQAFAIAISSLQSRISFG